ncbi:hypothetical protein D7Y41_34150 [Anaerotruncus sp. 1XD22-93]|nr:hypothetical protein [Lachnospiraceae bacterium]RKJ74850.1 hypothetical protein D7Y41_34150 [Anaerotruncus sp. 1XD22-93]
MAKSMITKIRRKKMAEASHTTGTVARITHIALGNGGVNENGEVLEPLPDAAGLNNEVIRRQCTSSRKVSDMAYEYTLRLENNEFIGTYFSEIALVDEDGDVAAISNFLAKGKDETEVTFSVEDSY